jgi:hypothetical protein
MLNSTKLDIFHYCLLQRYVDFQRHDFQVLSHKRIGGGLPFGRSRAQGRSLLECPVPTDYDDEKWIALYKKAILELDQAMVTHRIEEARAEIAGRIERLRGVPEAHAEELHAIDDARRMLQLLEGEEQRARAKAAGH